MEFNLDSYLNRMEIINHVGYKKDEGITRLALSDEDIQAREIIIQECMNLGMKVWEDAIGNIRGRKEGRKQNLPAVICGSHIDTVPNGGKYDGLLGVMTALETIRIIVENKIDHDHPIELIVFSIEESSRFNISTVGSKGISGNLEPSVLKTSFDKQGTSLYDALIHRGFQPEQMKDSILNPKEIKAFLELHIEQGPMLEKENINIGVVEAIAAPMRLQINLIGEEAHSGACPMDMRRDALGAAAEIILEVEKKGIEESKYKTVATTGNCSVFPGVMNVVPGEVNLSIDIRGIHLESVLRTLNHVVDCTGKICENRKIDYNIKVLSREKPVSLDRNLIELVKENCRKLGFTYKEMASGAGHDTMNIAKIVPSSLIFIPCIGGISHNHKENVKIEDMNNGIKIFFETLLSLAR